MLFSLGEALTSRVEIVIVSRSDRWTGGNAWPLNTGNAMIGQCGRFKYYDSWRQLAFFISSRSSVVDLLLLLLSRCSKGYLMMAGNCVEQGIIIGVFAGVGGALFIALVAALIYSYCCKSDSKKQSDDSSSVYLLLIGIHTCCVYRTYILYVYIGLYQISTYYL